MILNLFLKALQNRLSTKRGVFTPVERTIDTRYPAIKTYSIDLYLVDGEYNIVICSASATERCVTKEDKEYLKNKVAQEIIEKTLEYYGI